MKKVSGFCVLFLVVGTALNLIATNCGDRTTLIAVSRKLKENRSIRSNNECDAGHMTLDDYSNPIDPVPGGASVEPGPIEHGTPLNPYIPKPSPPGPPNKPGDSK